MRKNQSTQDSFDLDILNCCKGLGKVRAGQGTLSAKLGTVHATLGTVRVTLCSESNTSRGIVPPWGITKENTPKLLIEGFQSQINFIFPV